LDSVQRESNALSWSDDFKDLHVEVVAAALSRKEAVGINPSKSSVILGLDPRTQPPGVETGL
jgi:hypothetical protein